MLLEIVRRVGMMVVTLFGATIIIFFLLRLSGDPATVLLPDSATPLEVAAFRSAYGFDRPLIVQYADFLGDAIRGDFGRSFRYQQSAMSVVLDRVPATARLMVSAVALTLMVSIPIAFYGAIKDNQLGRTLLRMTTVLGQGVPGFVLAVLMIVVFSVQLHLLPSSGSNNFPRDMIMPSIVLASFTVPQTTRVLWTSLSEVLRSDYVRTAQSKGLSPWFIYGKHTLRNALIPFFTVVGLQVALLLGGSVITETIFAWPGLGQLLVQAISNRDYPVVQAGVAFVVFVFLIVNTVVDISYTWADPRLRKS